VVNRNSLLDSTASRHGLSITAVVGGGTRAESEKDVVGVVRLYAWSPLLPSQAVTSTRLRKIPVNSTRIIHSSRSAA
jgi:hypothetical protein